jgi:GTP cyclohydrolase I
MRRRRGERTCPTVARRAARARPVAGRVVNLTKLADIQSMPDRRNIAIDKVGVKGIEYPVTVLDRDRGTQHTVASINMYVNLPREFKGTHMSRFVEVLNRHRGEMNIKSFPRILRAMRKDLQAEEAHLEVTFPYFMRKRAPVSGAESLMEYRCTIHGVVNHGVSMGVKVEVPVTTLCPCSKEISSAGAHNQRGTVQLSVRFRSFLWIEDLIELVESCASCDIYALLKREDEKFVTERAYENPMFAEDVVRAVAEKLLADDNITWFSVDFENIESIHNHNAYAHIERDKKAKGR